MSKQKQCWRGRPATQTRPVSWPCWEQLILAGFIRVSCRDTWMAARGGKHISLLPGLVVHPLFVTWANTGIYRQQEWAGFLLGCLEKLSLLCWLQPNKWKCSVQNEGFLLLPVGRVAGHSALWSLGSSVRCHKSARPADEVNLLLWLSRENNWNIFNDCNCPDNS